MTQKPDMKNTKAEILSAYEELMKKKEIDGGKHPKEEKAEKQKEEIVNEATSLSAAGIVKGLADIKLQTSVSIDKIEDSLLQEFQKLEKLQKAVQYESDYLEELYGIKSNADSLAVLLTANKEKKRAFEAEMEQQEKVFEEKIQAQKETWKKEQVQRDAQWKETENDHKKTITREEEEYNYSRNLARKKEEDEYQAKKTAQENQLAEKKQSMEKDLGEREKSIVGKEQELKTLREQVENFPSILEKEIAEARKQQELQLSTKYQYEKELASKEMHGETKLLQQNIVSLQSKVKEQEAQIASLNQKANLAGDQVQAIALKALDTGGSRNYAPYVSSEKREEKESGK